MRSLIVVGTLLFGVSSFAQTFKVRIGARSTAARVTTPQSSRAEAAPTRAGAPASAGRPSACARYGASARLEDRFPKEHGAGAVALGIACHLDPERTYAEAARAIAVAPPSPIFAAAQATLCGAYLDDRSYLVWRHCQALLGEFNRAALPAALAQASDPAVQAEFLARTDAVRKRVDELAPKMSEHEQGYPGDKLFFDDAWKQVKQDFEPRLRRNQQQLLEIFAWQEKIAKGPGFAGDCVPRFTKMVSDYVRSVVSKPKGDELVEAMRDPIGVQLSEALAVCHQMKDADINDSSTILSKILPGARRALSNSDALGIWLGMQRSGKLYKNQPLDVGVSDPFSFVLPSPFGLEPFPNGLQIGPGQPVASVTVEKGKALIKFKRNVEINRVATNCRPTNRLSYIDINGHAVYEQDCKGSQRVVDDYTHKPIRVPLADAKKITPESRVGFFAPDNGGDGRIQYVRSRAGAVIWAVGVSLAD